MKGLVAVVIIGALSWGLDQAYGWRSDVWWWIYGIGAYCGWLTFKLSSEIDSLKEKNAEISNRVAEIEQKAEEYLWKP